MILTDGTNTYTNIYEDIEEDVVRNDNISVTIGGRIKSQVDSERMKIKSTIVITQSDFASSLNPILKNYSATLTYTPGRALYDRSTAAAMTVVLTGEPKIKQRVWDGSEIAFHLELNFEEVI